MDLVIDANILFAALIRSGLTAELLLMEELRLFAPEFLLEEFQKHRTTIMEKTARGMEDVARFMDILKRRITLVPGEALLPFLVEAQRIAPDEGDVPYLALALKEGCPLWSNDAALKKQSLVRVLSTEDLLRTLSEGHA